MKIPDLKPCPFCGGKARLSFKQCAYGGQNGFGEKRIEYCVQAICNKCHSRGKPVKTGWLINPYPHQYRWFDEAYILKLNNHARVLMETYRPHVEEAIENWNRRANDELR